MKKEDVMLKKIYLAFVCKLSIALSMMCLSLIASVSANSQEAFMGEIKLFPYTFCPRNYAETNGALLSISAYQALFSLLGTTYGGDGRSTFALPDLRGRVAINHGQGPGLTNYILGQKTGTETNTPTINQLTSHSHTATTTSTLKGTTDPGNVSVPTGAMLADDGTDRIYQSAPNGSVSMNPSSVLSSTTVATAGASQAINNRQPLLVLRYCIALEGTYPPRN